MEEIIPSDSTDLVRELIIVVVGLIIRAIEKRKLKKTIENAKSEDSGL